MNQTYNYAPQPTTASRPVGYQTWGQTQNQRVRPVSSVEEVRASSIDFDGSVFFFPDFANKRIYTKFITLDGVAAINMYELKEMPLGGEDSRNYITREEFESAIQQLKMAIPAVNPVVPKEEPNVSPLQF